MAVVPAYQGGQRHLLQENDGRTNLRSIVTTPVDALSVRFECAGFTAAKWTIRSAADLLCYRQIVSKETAHCKTRRCIDMEKDRSATASRETQNCVTIQHQGVALMTYRTSEESSAHKCGKKNGDLPGKRGITQDSVLLKEHKVLPSQS